MVLVIGSFSLAIGSIIPGDQISLYTSKGGALIYTFSIVGILPEIIKGILFFSFPHFNIIAHVRLSELQVNTEQVDHLEEMNKKSELDPKSINNRYSQAVELVNPTFGKNRGALSKSKV
jgi:hypothetical protein